MIRLRVNVHMSPVQSATTCKVWRGISRENPPVYYPTVLPLSRGRSEITVLRMKVFVTGGAGYIGSVCAEELLNAGHEVTVFDNLTEGHRRAVDNRAVFIQGRLSDEGTVNQAVKDSKCECILHFAANTLVGESMTNPGKYFRNNVAHGLNLLDAAVAAGVRKFVFSSTCATYGPPDRVPMTEDLPQRPINPYGESKLTIGTAHVCT